MEKGAESGGKCPYSRRQMESLAALCDTFLPEMEPPSGADDDKDISRFFRTSASTANTPHQVAILMGHKIRHRRLFLAPLALWVLSTAIGTWVLCGRKSLSRRFPYLQKFSRVSTENRKEIMHSWANSHFFVLRLLFNALKIFITLIFFSQVDEKGDNVSWQAIRYRSKTGGAAMNVQQLGNMITAQENSNPELGPLREGIIDLKSKEESLQKLSDLGFPVSLNPNRIRRRGGASYAVESDVVVIGSGCGGGVVAGVLAQQGYKTIVLEKGKYFPTARLPLLEGQAMDQMYLGNGIIGTDNMDILILAGSTVGGGSTINWSASIRTPPHVRKEWSENHELKLFESSAYDDAMDAVCGKIGVQANVAEEGFNNMVLRKGCDELRIPAETIPRNASSDHYCGSCCFGCENGGKRGVAETWLMDLVSSGNGAILPECEAVKIITSKRGGRKHAGGVSFRLKNGEFAVVESKITVVSCGAIGTPALLKKSRLKNRHIGRNLHLHPVVMGWGYFPDGPESWPETEKVSYEGAIMTAMSKSLMISNRAIIQTPALHPGMFSALMPWISGDAHKKKMLKFPRTANLFTLVRDLGTGEVNSPTDISYRVDDRDEENLRRGMEMVLRILAAAGAEEIGTQHKQGRVLNVKRATEEELEKFVKEESERGFRNLSSPMCSAHQMGSCRMGASPAESAVAPDGESWEVEGLYVADSSVFPTALGVNPMVTIQAIAYCTAQSILTRLRG
ncbi:hypothetical protein M569_13229, partial [Genlisea aurea]